MGSNILKNGKKHIFRDDNTKKWLINKKLKKYESKNTPMKNGGKMKI